MHQDALRLPHSWPMSRFLALFLSSTSLLLLAADLGAIGYEKVLQNPFGIVTEDLDSMQKVLYPSGGVVIGCADRFAQDKGLRPGAVITAIDGVAIQGRDSYFAFILENLKQGSFKLTVAEENPEDLQNPRISEVALEVSHPFREYGRLNIRKTIEPSRNAYVIRSITLIDSGNGSGHNALVAGQREDRSRHTAYHLIDLANGKILESHHAEICTAEETFPAALIGDRLIVSQCENASIRASRLTIRGFASEPVISLPIAGAYERVSIVPDNPARIFLGEVTHRPEKEWLGVDIVSGKPVSRVLPSQAVPIVRDYKQYDFTGVLHGKGPNRAFIFGGDYKASFDGKYVLTFEENGEAVHALKLNRSYLGLDIDNDGWDEVIGFELTRQNFRRDLVYLLVAMSIYKYVGLDGIEFQGETNIVEEKQQCF